MILVLVALYDEAFPLLRKLNFFRMHGISLYQGRLFGQESALALIGAGVARKMRLLKLMKDISAQYVINIGFAGALRQGLQVGEGYVVDRFVMLRQQEKELKTSLLQKVSLSRLTLLTHHELIEQSQERLELYDLIGADLIDMEGYFLVQLLEEARLTKRFLCIKIVGDNLQDSVYLKWEKNFRSFFKEKSILRRAGVILRTGLYPSLYVYQRKRFLQEQLVHYLEYIFKKLSHH
ncbi:MAG: hypothetical protein NZM25_02115 [Leptospiraceae bacterium]|nr:hypothetical protein [Leptospiraceae bacterium]MDW8306972.1 hypothetical protein [Leptospiraceae bacterium]